MWAFIWASIWFSCWWVKRLEINMALQQWHISGWCVLPTSPSFYCWGWCRWPGFMAWVKEVGNHTDLQPPHAWHSWKNNSSWYGMVWVWIKRGYPILRWFLLKNTTQRGFVCWPSSPAPTSRNNRSQLAWRQFTLCNAVCVICSSKLPGSFPSLPSLKRHSKLMTYRFTTVYWRFPPVPIWVNMTVVSRDDHLKYGWKWNMMKDVWNPHLVYHALRRIQVKPFLTSPAAHQLSAINTSNHLSINVNFIESFIDDYPIHWLINFWIFMEDKSMDSSHEKTSTSLQGFNRSVPNGPQRGFLAWPCVCARGVDKTPRHAKHKPLGGTASSDRSWLSCHPSKKSIEKTIGLKAARNLPWGPEFVPWPNFRTKQPHLPQVALPRHAMMARANVWVCFGTSEDPTKLFGIHEQAIDAKHLGQLWIWWCYSLCQNTLLLFSFYSTPLKRKFDRRYAEPLWEYSRVHIPVSLSFYQYSVSQCFADPSQSNICALQLAEVPGKQCSWQGGSDTPPNLVGILPTSTRDDIHQK